MSYSGADPDLLAAYAAQSLNAAEALGPVESRLHELEATLPRAVPHAPKIHDLVDRFVRLERRTRALGERVGVFGTKLRAALGGPSGRAPLAMHGLLFPNRPDSPPRPVGWDTWPAAARTAYLKSVDPAITSIRTTNPYAVGRIAGVAGKSLVNALAGSADGITNTVTFGLAPDIGPAFTAGDTAMAYRIGRVGGTVATGVAAPEVVGELAPVLGEQTAEGFVARRGVDMVLGAATDASLNPHHSADSMFEAGALGVSVGGVLEGAGQAYAAWRIGQTEPTVIAHGFDSVEQWQQFSDQLHATFAEAGYPDAQAAMQGSAALGHSPHKGWAFDGGPKQSDFDIAVASEQLVADVTAAGLKPRSGGMRTPPLNRKALDAVGLADAARQLSETAGRPVNFMAYRSFVDAIGHKPSIPLPKK